MYDFYVFYMYWYIDILHILPETNASLSLYVWNAYIPRNTCLPISTCLNCKYSPKQMWAYLYMSDMQIFPETNVSLSLHVWHAYIIIYSPKQMSAYLYMSEMQKFPETNVSLALHVSEMHTYPKTDVILCLHAWNAYIPRNKFEPISACLTCMYSPKQMWAYLYYTCLQCIHSPKHMWA